MSQLVQTASKDVLQVCSSNQVTVWYDTCELCYSDMSFFSSFDNANYVRYPNEQNARDTKGKLSYTTDDQRAIYGLVQCTRDLSAGTCYLCLQQMLKFHWECCGAQQEGKVLSKSCNFKYEDDKFLRGEPTILLAPLPSSAPLPSPPPYSNWKKWWERLKKGLYSIQVIQTFTQHGLH